MGEFKTLLLEGIFYEKDGRITVAHEGISENEDVLVDEALALLLGQTIQLALHYLPPVPMIPSRWGGGCCLWEPAGRCPAGHHENSGFLLNISGQGILRRQESLWWLELDTGSKQEIPLGLLPGHRARLVATTVFDLETLEKVRECLEGADAGQLETLVRRARNIKDIIARFQDVVRKDK